MLRVSADFTSTQRLIARHFLSIAAALMPPSILHPPDYFYSSRPQRRDRGGAARRSARKPAQARRATAQCAQRRAEQARGSRAQPLRIYEACCMYVRNATAAQRRRCERMAVRRETVRCAMRQKAMRTGCVIKARCCACRPSGACVRAALRAQCTQRAVSTALRGHATQCCLPITPRHAAAAFDFRLLTLRAMPPGATADADASMPITPCRYGYATPSAVHDTPPPLPTDL